MYPRRVFPAIILTLILCLAHLTASQDSNPQVPRSDDSGAEPVAKLHVMTRMVTLEIVVKDHRGQHVENLKASDFQVFEQAPSRGKTKREQKIVAFREARLTDLASKGATQVQVPAGVYSNLVTLQKEPVPATILLVDGLNTEVQHQAQVHVQMVRMLRSLPREVPVAVFLLGNRLQMLQDFTTDRSLLQTALEGATSVAGTKVATVDPRDDPDELSAQLDKINNAGGSGGSTSRISEEMLDEVKNFEQRVYAGTMDIRVERTIDALTSLARHISGYPGRKNLLWISSTFPIYLRPLDSNSAEISGFRYYGEQLRSLSAVLSETKVAVYPINPAGVEASMLYQAGTRPRDVSPAGTSDTLDRETMTWANEQDTMELIAVGTGGKTCTGNNDLGECVRKAVDDSSAFYEIAYYPDSANWSGEYRTIIVKTKQPGLNLAYRQGYFAKLEDTKSEKDQESELKKAACDDYVNATSIFLAARPLPADSPERLKFYLAANPTALTLTPTSDGGYDLNILTGACTFDKKGAPMQLMTEAVRRKLDAKEYQSLMTNGLPHIISIPSDRVASVRLLVRDVPSGRLGSVLIRAEGFVPAMSKTIQEVQRQPTVR